MANDRRITLSSKHFFGRNFGVESRTAKNRTGLKNGKIESSLEYDYNEVQTMSDMMNVITNFMVIVIIVIVTAIMITMLQMKYYVGQRDKADQWKCQPNNWLPRKVETLIQYDRQ